MRFKNKINQIIGHQAFQVALFQPSVVIVNLIKPEASSWNKALSWGYERHIHQK